MLLLSPGLRQSGELLHKVLEIYRAIDCPVPADAGTLLRLELANDSRIVALPGSERTIRGYSAPTLILVDEAGGVDDALMGAATRMQATVPRARLIALSTPVGKRGWWWQAWEHGGKRWHRVRRTAANLPRIDPAFLEAERATMTASQYAREYECSFEEADQAVFPADAVACAISDRVAPLPLPPKLARRWRSA